MSMPFLKKYFFVILLLPLSSCFLAVRQKMISELTPIPQSSKKLDIPTYPNGKPFSYWHFCKVKEAQLGLRHPETSTDSFIFRMWLTVPDVRTNQRHDLFEFSYQNNTWTAQVISMRVDLYATKMHEQIVYQKRTDIKVDNWQQLLDSFRYWRMATLPTDERLPDYDAKKYGYRNSGATWCFEYATPKLYRFYQYHNPWVLANEYSEAEHVTKFILLAERIAHVDSLSRSLQEDIISGDVKRIDLPTK